MDKIITTHGGIAVDSFAHPEAMVWFARPGLVGDGHFFAGDLDDLIAALIAHRDARVAAMVANEMREAA